jgi:hypothetical protein
LEGAAIKKARTICGAIVSAGHTDPGDPLIIAAIGITKGGVNLTAVPGGDLVGFSATKGGVNVDGGVDADNPDVALISGTKGGVNVDGGSDLAAISTTKGGALHHASWWSSTCLANVGVA